MDAIAATSSSTADSSSTSSTGSDLTRMRHVGIVGGTGRVGRYLVYKLVQQGLVQRQPPQQEQPGKREQRVHVHVYVRDRQAAKERLGALFRDTDADNSSNNNSNNGDSPLPANLTLHTLDLSRPDTFDAKAFDSLDALFVTSGSMHVTRVTELLGVRAPAPSHPRTIEVAALQRLTDIVLASATCHRLVVVSSVCVTSPFHPIAMLLNGALSMVLKHKLEAESYIRAAFARAASANAGKKSYTIVRPGGITAEMVYTTTLPAAAGAATASAATTSNESNDCTVVVGTGGSVRAELAARGSDAWTSVDGTSMRIQPLAPVVGQGDVLRGRISRDSVAQLLVHCLDEPRARNATIDCVWPNAAFASIGGLSGLRKLPSNPQLPAFSSCSFDAGVIDWSDVRADVERPPVKSVRHELPFVVVASAVVAVGAAVAGVVSARVDGGLAAVLKWIRSFNGE